MVSWVNRTPEQRAKYVANAKAKRHAKALAEGRVPGQIGTPIRVTEEQKAISLAKKRKRDSISSLKIRTAKRAAKAIAEGRIPGKAGQPARLTSEERAANLKKSYTKYRLKNLTSINKRDAEKKRKARATLEGALKHRAAISKLRAKRKAAPGTHTATE